MKARILVALVLTPLFLVDMLFLPPVCLAVTVSVIVAMASYELLRATKVAHNNSMYAYTAVAAALIPVGHWAGYGSIVTRGVAICLMAALFFPAIRRFNSEGEIRYEHIMVCLFGGLLVPTCLSALVQLKGMENGNYLVLLPVICAFLTDVGAYFAGVFLGKHRGITKVSPNKSLEGYIGGILSGCIFMLIYALVLKNVMNVTVSFPIMAVYGLLGSAITELGDLSFSLIKRQCGVKDYGNLMPGHGGMMDRFDSMSFAAPLLLVLVELFPAF